MTRIAKPVIAVKTATVPDETPVEAKQDEKNIIQIRNVYASPCKFVDAPSTCDETTLTDHCQ